MTVATEFHSYQEAQDPFEAEETLSLSDLPITGDSAQCDDSYSKKMADFNDDDGDDFFEFISEDFTAPNRGATVEKDIIFCGKIINTCYKESLNDVVKQSNYTPLHQNGDTDTTSSSVLLPWIPNKSSLKPTRSRNSNFNKGQEWKDSKNLRCDYSVGKVSLMRSATKSRWYLFMFGMAAPMRLTTEMELSDIKSRQIRRRSPAAVGGEVAMGKSKGKNLWLGKILKSLGLGCRNSKQTNDVVKSFRAVEFA